MAASKVSYYYQLTKPGIIYANVLTGLAGYLLASRWHVKWLTLIGLILGMSLVIACACVLNNYLDRKLDAKMNRTKQRALVTGELSVRAALSYGLILGLIGFGLLIGLTNGLTVTTGVLALIFYVVIYGYAKRRSEYGTLVGTLPGAASLIAGYLAVTDKLSYALLWLLIIMVCWQMAHFYAIAVYRLKDYKAAGLPVWPVKRGLKSTKLQINMFIVGFILASICFGLLNFTGVAYSIVLALVGGYWLGLASKGFKANDDQAWAKQVFLVSLLVILTTSIMLPLARLSIWRF